MVNFPKKKASDVAGQGLNYSSAISQPYGLNNAHGQLIDFAKVAEKFAPRWDVAELWSIIEQILVMAKPENVVLGSEGVVMIIPTAGVLSFDLDGHGGIEINAELTHDTSRLSELAAMLKRTMGERYRIAATMGGGDV